MTNADLLAFFAGMGVAKADRDRLLTEELKPVVVALERASPRLRSSGLKPFNDLLGRELEELVGLLGLDVPIEPRDYYPENGN